MCYISKVINSLIKDKGYAEYLHSINLRAEYLNALVCSAPISLFKKLQILEKLLSNEPKNGAERFDYEARLEVLNRIIDELNLTKEENGVFLLVGHADEDGRQIDYECAPFKSYPSVQSYLSKVFEDGGEEKVWYTLEKWLPETNGDDLTAVSEFVFVGKAPCFYKDLRYLGDKSGFKRDFSRKEEFSLFFSGNCLNLPTPFSAGDVLKIDCRPFASETIITVKNNFSATDCCSPICEYIAANGKKTEGALKHSHIYPRSVFDSVSPLYNLEWEKR